MKKKKKEERASACGDCRALIYLPFLILRASDIEGRMEQFFFFFATLHHPNCVCER